jgi:hypothetical protein
MRTAAGDIQGKLRMLRLADELGNVSRACELAGYSRQQFYAIQRRFRSSGLEGLVNRRPGPRHPKVVTSEVERAILDISLAHPERGAVALAQDLGLRGIRLSAGGVRGVWMRHKLGTKKDRLRRLHRLSTAEGIELSPDQLRLLERFVPELVTPQLSASHPGALVALACCRIKVSGEPGGYYLYEAVDYCSGYAWAWLDRELSSHIAMRLLKYDVLSTLARHLIRLKAVVTSRARPLCGRVDHHPVEIFLRTRDIEHLNFPAGLSRRTEIITSFHQTLLSRHFTACHPDTPLRDMREALDGYLYQYNCTPRADIGFGICPESPRQLLADAAPASIIGSRVDQSPSSPSAGGVANPSAAPADAYVFAYEVEAAEPSP